jgi:hypothetical protein
MSVDLQQLILELEAAADIGLEEMPVSVSDLEALSEGLKSIRLRLKRLDDALGYAKSVLFDVGYRRSYGQIVLDRDGEDAERARKIHAEIERMEEGE